ncbi:unnamed protein product [Staurois parvus]|uniref:Uncharacterized protein n=1 Tax=Staurois parvus TaxID=386267 RepID=A0ABN9AYT3_9NEOB|nr:unnamed protein product [Staurois parvus]
MVGMSTEQVAIGWDEYGVVAIGLGRVRSSGHWLGDEYGAVAIGWDEYEVVTIGWG